MIRIAIVEDNRGIRESLAAYVQKAPTEMQCVCTCSTAEEALEVLPQQKPDVVLMDIQLPNLSGIECAARLKQLQPEVKIIMVTVYGNPERIFNALRAGACGYLLKTCTPEELLTAANYSVDTIDDFYAALARIADALVEEKPSGADLLRWPAEVRVLLRAKAG